MTTIKTSRHTINIPQHQQNVCAFKQTLSLGRKTYKDSIIAYYFASNYDYLYDIYRINKPTVLSIKNV